MQDARGSVLTEVSDVRFLKRMFCRHEIEFVRDIYGDEIIERGWKRSIWKCSRCGKIVMRDQLHELPNVELTGLRLRLHSVLKSGTTRC